MSVAEYVKPGICHCCGAGNRLVWPPEAIVAAAQRWNIERGRPPRAREWDAGTPEHPAQTTVWRVFGHWNNMLAAAGLAADRGKSYPLIWTKDAIADAMLDHLFRTGEWPRENVWKYAAEPGVRRPGASTVRDRFGSWTAAKRYAGWRDEVRRESPTRCAGCGTELDNFTDGCTTCTNRRHLRARRAKRGPRQSLPAGASARTTGATTQSTARRAAE